MGMEELSYRATGCACVVASFVGLYALPGVPAMVLGALLLSAGTTLLRMDRLYRRRLARIDDQRSEAAIRCEREPA